MADIKNYLREKEKREQNKIDYQTKIRKHRMNNIIRFALVLMVLVAIVILIVVQYSRHIYTGYDIVSTIKREIASDAVDMRLQNAVLTYSKDGAHCTDIKGNVNWNQTYEIQDIKIATCQDVVAIGDYNGREIYIQNTQKQLGTIDTAMPIRDLAVSSSGYVTAVLADTDVTWINTYNLEGEMIYTGYTSMGDSGYPAAVSISPNGELMAVSYLYVDAGVLKTDIAFYNLGPVGSNYNDYLVGGYTCHDAIVPEIQFMNNSTAFAVGDNQLRIYTGDQIPVEAGGYFFNEEIQSVFYNENYIGLVFISEKAEVGYRMDVYNAGAQKVGSYYFDIDYTDIFFGEKNITIYNETECLVMTFDGVEKYKGNFTKTVNLMLPTGADYKYVLVTDNSIDTIQLK